ncbi:hypothetical protein FSARC_14034 [Fusarium sarcochroum]|uniref:Uncharacterized protein n=1 Tax=Fusarium sarcochroum TaxID=1208366 RepID=A0A8H4SX76_9HYPO|nr:hypothetical protein FSARC_14034 [Fusarium sarcochroum]
MGASGSTCGGSSGRTEKVWTGYGFVESNCSRPPKRPSSSYGGSSCNSDMVWTGAGFVPTNSDRPPRRPISSYGSPNYHDQGQGGPYNNGPAYGQQTYGQNRAPSNPPPYSSNPSLYGQPLYAPPPNNLHPNNYGGNNLPPRPHSNGPLPPQARSMPLNGPFGLFAPEFMVFLEKKTMTISKHPGDSQLQADLNYSTHHKMELFHTGGGGRSFIAAANSAGFTGSRINVYWADGRSSEMKASGGDYLTFDLNGDVFEWVKAERREISGILGRDAGKGFILGRQSGKGEAYAMFSQSGRFDVKKSTGWFCFVGPGASGQMGSDWANIAVLAMLKLWQSKAATKKCEDSAVAMNAAVGAAVG